MNQFRTEMERLLVGEYGCIQDLSLHEILENVAAVRQFRVITSPALRYLTNGFETADVGERGWNTQLRR